MGRLIDQLDITISRAKQWWRIPDGPRPVWRCWLDRWRLQSWYPSDQEAEQRRQMAKEMCQSCAWRWKVGRSIRHWTCAHNLSGAIDAHFERLDQSRDEAVSSGDQG